MRANLEQHNARLLVLRVGGELKKSELDAAQSEFVKKIAGAGTVRRLVLLEDFTGWERGDTDFFFTHRNDFEKIAVVGNPRWEATGAGIHGRGSSQRTGEVFSRNSRIRGARVARRVSAEGIYAHSLKAMTSVVTRRDGTCL